MKTYINESSLIPAFLGPKEFTEYAKQQDAVTKQWMQALSLER